MFARQLGDGDEGQGRGGRIRDTVPGAELLNLGHVSRAIRMVISGAGVAQGRGAHAAVILRSVAWRVVINLILKCGNKTLYIEYHTL